MNSGLSGRTAGVTINDESTYVIWFKTFKRNRSPAKLGKQEITDVAQAVETRCRSQPAYILEIRVKAPKLFTYNLRNQHRFRRKDSLRAQHAKQMTERAAKVCGGARTWLAAMGHGKVYRKKAMQHRLSDAIEINVLRSQPPSEVGRALQIVLDSNTCVSAMPQVSGISSDNWFEYAVPCDDFRNVLRDHGCSPQRWR